MNKTMIGILMLFMFGSVQADLIPTISCNSLAGTCLLGIANVPSNTALGYNALLGYNTDSVLYSNVLFSNTINSVITNSISVSNSFFVSSPQIAQAKSYSAGSGQGNVVMNNVTIQNQGAVSTNVLINPTNSVQFVALPVQPNVLISIVANGIPPITPWNYNKVVNPCANANDSFSYSNSLLNFSLTAKCNVNLNRTIIPGNVYDDALKNIVINVPITKLNENVEIPFGGRFLNSTLNFSANTLPLSAIYTNPRAMSSLWNETSSVGCLNKIKVYPQNGVAYTLCSEFANQSLPTLNDICSGYDFLTQNFSVQGALCMARFALFANSSAIYWHSQYVSKVADNLNLTMQVNTLTFEYGRSIQDYNALNNSKTQDQQFTSNVLAYAVIIFGCICFLAAIYLIRTRKVQLSGDRLGDKK